MPPRPVMPQIKTVVFLMLENRSLDNLLGWLYADGAPRHVYPAGSPPEYDGLQLGLYSQPYETASQDVVNYPIVPLPDDIGPDWVHVPFTNPSEAMYDALTWNGVLNQLFGDYRRIPGMPQSGQTPRNLGFYQDYYDSSMTKWHGMDILWTYRRHQTAVINRLAAAYAVSDAWFSSVPTQTNPNRAYSIIGTSQGRETNLHYTAIEQFDGPTIFNVLGQAGKSWSLFYEDLWQNQQCYTEYTFPNLSNSGGQIAQMNAFFEQARDGKLADFTYLEPKWGYSTGSSIVQGSDYHPPTSVIPGELFLLLVYQALRRSPQWGEMLFIVTFDEHGGTYDHVPPQWGAINPDGKIGPYGFRFDLFGARVPTLLISPFIRPSTVFRAPAGSPYPYDHTSFLKTLVSWAGGDLSPFGNRAAAAPSFDEVLAPEHVNDSLVEVDLPTSAAETTMKPLNDLFEGIPAASVRAILERNKALAGIMEDIDRYRADPQQFEASLVLQ